VAPVENPEEALEITPLDWGNLVHGALEAFILEVLARPEADRPVPDQRWPEDDRARLLELGDAQWAALQAAGRAGRPIFWRRDRARLHADLNRFLDGDDENRARHGTRPLAAELAFGFSGSTVEPVPVTLADGRTVRFRGMADRVDIGDDGTIHIVDYKTGSAFGYDVLADDPVAAGRKLQLTVYGLAGRLHRAAPDAPVLAEYWFVSKKGDFKRIGYHVTDEILARAGTVIGTIVAGIEHGVFPAHPDVSSTTPTWIGCRACDPDGLGVIELRRAWDRKRHDPALAPYAELADVPDEVETLTAGDPDA
jgi:ATP-dependent helicase/nuclease subunit B